MEKTGPVVIAVRCEPVDAEHLAVIDRLMACLKERCPTYWIGSDAARTVSVDAAGRRGQAKLWVAADRLVPSQDPVMPLVMESYITAVLCRSADIRWLHPAVRNLSEGRPCFLTDAHAGASANQVRCEKRSGYAFQTVYQRFVQGVVVLPEHLFIIRSERLWREREVVVIPDNTSIGHRPENKVEAMARQMASYLDTGATRVVLPAEFLLAQPDPLKAYDDLHTLIARERKTKTA